MPRKRPCAVSPLVVADRERKFFASELHDTVCQSLASLSLHASVMLRRKQAGKSIQEAELRTLESRLGQVLDQSRAMAAFDIIRAKPDLLPEKIRELVRLFGSDQDRDFRFSLAGDFECPPEVALHLYRIVRETIHAFSHHRDPGCLRIALHNRASLLRLQIQCTNLSPRICSKLFAGDGLLTSFCDLLSVSWRIRGTTLECCYPAR